MRNIFKKYPEQIRMTCMFLILFICMSAFAVIQPYGDGPDEINRFKLVEYIYNHGTLPAGDHPEVLIDGYGASYAFQPMLTYIIDGYLLKAISFLEPSLEMRVLISRFVNIGFGLLTAYYVRKISRLLFKNEKTAWAFTLAIVFLPQNVFVHTYVNTDSMGLLSVAMVLYAIIKGLQDDYSKSTCIHMALGVILCALSYYNCYGIILCGVLAFFFHFVRSRIKPDKTTRSLYLDYKPLLKKGIFISIIVLLCISWWFIRNAILYEGDFLALTARQLCAAETGLEAFNPFTRDTYQRLGIPVMSMIFDTDYFTLVWKSFIAMFGPMLIPTHHYIYMAFRDLFFICVIGWFLPYKSSALHNVNPLRKAGINVIMLLAAIIPAFLAVYYSYTWEFQPQGRYFLPMVIPFMYFLTLGLEKIILLLSEPLKKYKEKAGNMVASSAYHLLYAFLTACLLYATFVSMVGYYK